MLKNVYHFVTDFKIPTLSGALCFFILVNGGSYLFLFVSIIGIFSKQFIINNVIYSDFINLLPDYLKGIFVYLIDHNASIPISLFLFLSSIYSSSSLYYHFLQISEIITKRTASFKFSKRVQAIIFVPIVLIFIYFSIALISYIYSFNFIYSYLFIVIFLLLILYFLNFLALKRFKRLYKGIIFSFFYELLFTIGFIIFLRYFNSFKVVYGFFSFFIIFLFYLYISIIGIFLGIYINFKNLEVFKMLTDK